MQSNLPDGALAVDGFQLCISKWALCPFCHHLHIILKFGFQTLCPQYEIKLFIATQCMHFIYNGGRQNFHKKHLSSTHVSSKNSILLKSNAC